MQKRVIYMVILLDDKIGLNTHSQVHQAVCAVQLIQSVLSAFDNAQQHNNK